MAGRGSWELSVVPITIGLLATPGISMWTLTAVAVWCAVGVVTLIAIAVHPEGETDWLEQGVVEEARSTYPIPVRTVSVSPGRRV